MINAVYLRQMEGSELSQKAGVGGEEDMLPNHLPALGTTLTGVRMPS